MKSIDIKSVIIGVLGSVLIFTLLGLQRSGNNFSDIRVKSLTIENGGDFIIEDANGNPRLLTRISKTSEFNFLIRAKNLKPLFAITEQVGPSVTFFNPTSKAGIIMTALDDEGISINLSNMHGVVVAKISSSSENNGVIALFDKEGELGWIQGSGK